MHLGSSLFVLTAVIVVSVVAKTTPSSAAIPKPSTPTPTPATPKSVKEKAKSEMPLTHENSESRKKPLNIGILVPDMSGSQYLFNHRVAEVLVDAGHKVTMMRLQLLGASEGYKGKARADIEEWIVNALHPDLDPQELKRTQVSAMFTDESAWTMLYDSKRHQMIANVSKALELSCEQILKNKEFLQRLKESKFDVVFSHMYDFCPVGLAKLSGAPAWVWVNSGALKDYVASYMGLVLPASYAAPMMADASDRLTFWQRVKSVIGHTVMPFMMRRMSSNAQSALFKRFLDPEFPDLSDLAKTAPLVFVNSNELFDLPKPTLDKIVNIGGMGMRLEAAKPLPAEYEKLLASRDAAIVFTFGSVVNATAMPLEWKQAFMAAFQNFPNTQFFMRYEGNDLTPPPNVHLSPWLPQLDLLRHPKTRAFITHGGYNGVQEAINCGKPLIAIPLFGDQFRNGQIAQKHGFGLVVPKPDINEQTLTDAIRAMLVEERFSRAVQEMQHMVERKPIAPETLLVRWTEFVAEFKTLDNLRPVGAELDWFTYWNVDVYVVFFGSIALVFTLVFLLLRRLLRCCGLCGGPKAVDAKKNKKD